MAKRKLPEIPKTKIVSAIRRLWFYSFQRREAVKRCKEGKFYRCEKCKKLNEKIQVDHINPTVNPETGWDGYDGFITRMFCPSDQLKNLCHGCHKVLTDSQNKVRVVTRRNKKNER